MLTPQVLDLSHNDPPIDMHALQGQGIKAIICKCDELSFRDPACRDLVARARSVGFLVGLYVFFRGEATGAQQIEQFLTDAEGLGEVIVAIDYEEHPPLPTQATPAILEDGARTLVALKGRHPVIYSDNMLLNSGLPAISAAWMCPLWLVNIEGGQVSKPPLSNGEVVLQQYTWNLNGAGLDGSAWIGSQPIEDWWASQVLNL